MMAFRKFMGTKFTKGLIVLFIILQLAACSNEDSEGMGTVTVYWTAPLARADETTPLSPAEIDGYRVYYGKVSGDYLNQLEIIDSTTQEATVTATRGLYYFVFTCFDTDGRESGYSKEFSIRI